MGNANEDLITWNTRWRLSQGGVLCRTCGVFQPESEKEVAFEHLPGSGHAGQSRNPWGELDTICERFKR